MTDMSQLGDAILAARLESKLPAPTRQWYGSTDIENAYEVQDNVLAEILRRRGGQIIGRKAGCTNQSARDLLGLDGPFHGALLSGTEKQSPARIAREDYPFIILEPEFALRIGTALQPGATPHTAKSVVSAVDAIVPAIEIVSSCHDEWTAAGPALLIADNGSSYGWVRGEPVTDWTVEDVMAAPVALSVDGTEVASGSAANVDGGPFEVLAWMANRIPLEAGSYVSTGTTTNVHPAERGETIEAQFGPFGHVRVEVV
ncbi:fumarylacetoacetate hydrolase family protein [Nisaea acidiphila]|uniref:Fumarylacetoacetate hydrolase family protein n=1 Tax=Nisaea acidiphila TaxID=1862145 RepID=A0A9J7AXV5_9PROT|nr:fumarylacetoacetate hydrolase family protein [Nisaea acidiphila]UUX51902.1 fumarylacetoacetate hydrolase family protein [Nisaea acidiphila]